MAYVQEKKLNKKKIGVVPVQVDPAHIHGNGGLLTPEEIAAIPKNLNTRVSKKAANGASYTVLAQGDNIYAVYGHKVVLGKGGYGKVKLAQDVRTNEWVALKVVAMQDRKGKVFSPQRVVTELGYLMKEVEILHRLTGKGLMVEDPNPKIPKYHVIMKLADGSTADNLRQRNDLISSNNRCIIAHNMMKALNELHGKGYIHRDIKGGNIIINPYTNEVGIVDLGMAEEKQAVLNDKTAMGTPGYMAPEVANEDNSAYTEKSDVYAMGVTLAKWFNLNVNLKTNSDDFRVVSSITESKRFAQMFPDSSIRKQILNLVHGMCEKDVNKRLDGKQAQVLLQNITNKLNFSNLLTNTVGVLNVDEFRNMNSLEQKSLCDALKKFDRVVLLYPRGDSSITDTELTKVYQALRKAEVRCDNESYGYTEDKKAQAIGDLEATLNAGSKTLMQAMHVTTNNSMYAGNFLGADDASCKVVVTPDKTSDEYKQAMLSSNVSNKSLDKVKEELQLELLRIKDKYGASPQLAHRDKKINEFITYLDKQPAPITYQQLAEQLKKLSQELHKVNQPNNFMKFFKGPTHTEKLVEKIHSSMTPKNKS